MLLNQQNSNLHITGYKYNVCPVHLQVLGISSTKGEKEL